MAFRNLYAVNKLLFPEFKLYLTIFYLLHNMFSIRMYISSAINRFINLQLFLEQFLHLINSIFFTLYFYFMSVFGGKYKIKKQ